MARTIVGSAVVIRQKYYWPDVQMNIWFIIMLVTTTLILGVNAQFMSQQSTLGLGVPWILPYGITVGSLGAIFIIIMMMLVMQRRLLPGTVFLLSFILLVLFITGVVGTAIQLFGGPNINNLCNRYVFNNRQSGASIQTLAWLQQQNICQCWQAVFAFWIIGSVFMIWMMVIASQVNQNQYE